MSCNRLEGVDSKDNLGIEFSKDHRDSSKGTGEEAE
jgi:hypothetical protein